MIFFKRFLALSLLLSCMTFGIQANLTEMYRSKDGAIHSQSNHNKMWLNSANNLQCGRRLATIDEKLAYDAFIAHEIDETEYKLKQIVEQVENTQQIDHQDAENIVVEEISKQIISSDAIVVNESSEQEAPIVSQIIEAKQPTTPLIKRITKKVAKYCPTVSGVVVSVTCLAWLTIILKNLH